MLKRRIKVRKAKKILSYATIFILLIVGHICYADEDLLRVKVKSVYAIDEKTIAGIIDKDYVIITLDGVNCNLYTVQMAGNLIPSIPIGVALNYIDKPRRILESIIEEHPNNLYLKVTSKYTASKRPEDLQKKVKKMCAKRYTVFSYPYCVIEYYAGILYANELNVNEYISKQRICQNNKVVLENKTRRTNVGRYKWRYND